MPHHSLQGQFAAAPSLRDRRPGRLIVGLGVGWVLGLGLQVRSGNPLDTVLRVGVLGLGLGLWLATVWLLLLAGPS